MDKLRNKFEDIYFEHVMYQNEDAFKSVQIYMEETKKIAIAYHKWMKDTELVRGCMELGNYNTFEQFIEEYYE